jgi:sialic acid synthase SpsE
MDSVKLGERTIDGLSAPYIIAEIGVNHEGSIEAAKALIRMAKAGGADAAKFQTYQADLLAIKESPAYWDTSEEATPSQYELFSKFKHFTSSDYVELAKYCAEVEIDFCSTPFDLDAVEMLDPLVNFFKVASADITNVPLLRRIGECGKPVVLSSGASTVDEVRTACLLLRQSGSGPVIILHCILNYPTKIEDAHLRMIRGLQADFPDHFIGYSDHTKPTLDMEAMVTASILGAVVIEKHFTLDKSLPGNDHYHAMDARDLTRFRERMAVVGSLLGDLPDKVPLDSEEPARLYARRSVVMAKSVRQGEVITEQDLISLRPGTGIGPEHWDQIVGRSASRDLSTGDQLLWDDLVSES